MTIIDAILNWLEAIAGWIPTALLIIASVGAVAVAAVALKATWIEHRRGGYWCGSCFGFLRPLGCDHEGEGS